jgi:hypothetical protein
VHASGEIQAQLHGLGADRGQPGRRGRRQIEGHHIVEPQGLLDDLLGGELLRAVAQPQQAAAAAHLGAKVGDVGLLEGGAGTVEDALIETGGAALRRDLNRRIGRIEIGQRIEAGDHQHPEQQQILPQRKTIHRGSAVPAKGGDYRGIVRTPKGRQRGLQSTGAANSWSRAKDSSRRWAMAARRLAISH